MTDYIVTDLLYHGKMIRAAALYDDMVLTELRTESEKSGRMAGCIYRGYVRSVARNIGGAYIDIGYKTPVFLPLRGKKDIQPSNPVTVQIRKEASGIKEPSASLDLQIPGRYIVTSLKPGKRSFSSLLTDSEKNELKRIIPDEMCVPYHITIRTNARSASPEDLLCELKAQREELTRILKEAGESGKGRLLWGPPAFYEEMLRDFRKQPDRIFSDIPVCAETLDKISGEHSKQPVLYTPAPGHLKLAERYSLGRNLDLLNRKKVWLPCGGFLFIEKTEAFQVIDVNSGHCSRHKSPEETYLLINREAAKETARQIRLRDLSGMILVDFINMEEQEHKEELLTYMRTELAADTARPEALDITALGIMEIVRPKVRKPLAEVLDV